MTKLMNEQMTETMTKPVTKLMTKPVTKSVTKPVTKSDLWFQYRLRYRPKLSANLSFSFGVGPKPN